MGSANRQALTTLWQPASASATVDAGQAWREAREQVPGLASLGWLSRSRSRETSHGGTVYHEYFFNCLDDALRTAADTLTARIERFGASSPEVRAWVEAQDQVFANCSRGETIPEPLDESWDPLIRADRAYQIAAAHFYATHYARAEEHFRAIARDPASPWRELAAYPGSVFPYYRLGQAMLPDSAVELLNHGLTTEEMLRLSDGEALPDPWRRCLALATWTRAVVTGDHVLAVRAAEVVSARAPELADEMRAFTEAGPGDKAFAAVWTMLRFPGLTPVVRWNVGRRTPIAERDSLRDNGWCADVLEVDELPGRMVRDVEQIAAVQASRPSGGLPASPNYLGRIVLARAENHPDDPRLPEALHRVVQATRYGCAFEGYGEVSRAAFRTLHSRFPSSPWTRKTPYWFG